VGNGGHDFAPTPSGHVGEDKINDCPANVGESVPVEEKKRSAAVALPQEF
jgi:dGTP triphosphohydrolase